MTSSQLRMPLESREGSVEVREVVHTALFAEEDEPGNATLAPNALALSPPPRGRFRPGTYLNFFKGALYDPPACAMVE